MNNNIVKVGDYFINTHRLINEIYEVTEKVREFCQLRVIGTNRTFQLEDRIILMEFKRCDENGKLINNNLKNKNMEKQNQLQEVSIGNNGETAVLISPKMSGKLALVDLATLKRIISGLSQASFEHIKETFVEKIKNTKELEQLVYVTKEEINFHESVNIIKTIEITEDVQESKH